MVVDYWLLGEEGIWVAPIGGEPLPYIPLEAPVLINYGAEVGLVLSF